VLSRPEAVTLLRRRVPGLIDDQADALAELLGDLPLALEQAAAYLNQTQLPPADYLHLLTTRGDDMYGRGLRGSKSRSTPLAWGIGVLGWQA
jgi:hypothetical protein